MVWCRMSDPSNVSMHMFGDDEGTGVPASNQSGEKPFECDVCMKRFTQSSTWYCTSLSTLEINRTHAKFTYLLVLLQSYTLMRTAVLSWNSANKRTRVVVSSDVRAGNFPEIFLFFWRISGKFPTIFPEIFRKNMSIIYWLKISWLSSKFTTFSCWFALLVLNFHQNNIYLLTYDTYFVRNVSVWAVVYL